MNSAVRWPRLGTTLFYVLRFEAELALELSLKDCRCYSRACVVVHRHCACLSSTFRTMSLLCVDTFHLFPLAAAAVKVYATILNGNFWEDFFDKLWNNRFLLWFRRCRCSKASRNYCTSTVVDGGDQCRVRGFKSYLRWSARISADANSAPSFTQRQRDRIFILAQSTIYHQGKPVVFLCSESSHHNWFSFYSNAWPYFSACILAIPCVECKCLSCLKTTVSCLYPLSFQA